MESKIGDGEKMNWFTYSSRLKRKGRMRPEQERWTGKAERGRVTIGYSKFKE